MMALAWPWWGWNTVSMNATKSVQQQQQKNIRVRRSSERGFADHGWLKSYHSFSFADYYDPEQMGFRTLRVINDDLVAPGAGFPTHPHRDMEIFSYVMQGTIEHKDSLGNGRQLRPGEVQLMSAGRGVTHSEFNPSSTEALRLLQIWIQPRQKGLQPSYTEWKPSPEQATAPKVLIISPDGREGSAIIQQDAEVYRLKLQPGQQVYHEVKSGRGFWLQVAEGEMEVDDVLLQRGDAASGERPGSMIIRSRGESEALLFDLK
jgi:hypothetical protein